MRIGGKIYFFVEGVSMVSAKSPQVRDVLLATIAALFLLGSTVAQAQESPALPDYVIKKYGSPPSIPTGPLNKELQAAVKVAFIDSSSQSAWGKEQEAAIGKIAKS
ncbi:MAG: hypothetical protein AAGD43_19130, partial [Pseudomonadota bacterium]